MPWRCKTCSTCLTTASWQNRKCSWRGPSVWSTAQGLLALGLRVSPCTPPPAPAPPLQPAPHFLLQHVLPLLPHAPHQPRQLRDPVPGLHLLHRRIEQCKGSRAAHPRAVVGRRVSAGPRVPPQTPPHPPAWGPPAVHDDWCVQGPLMQAVCMHLLDEAQQVARAVRQAPAGCRPEGREQGQTDTLTHHPHTHRGQQTHNSGQVGKWRCTSERLRLWSRNCRLSTRSTWVSVARTLLSATLRAPCTMGCPRSAGK